MAGSDIESRRKKKELAEEKILAAEPLLPLDHPRMPWFRMIR